MEKITAIILSAGKGTRMNSNIHKQYMLLNDKPILFYSLNEFQNSIVDEIILVVGQGEIEYCKNEIVDKYKVTKVKKILEGGKERYNSVYEALKYIEYSDYVLIHDGARPFVSQEIINSSIKCVKKYNACAVGMPTKDTIKLVDGENFSIQTPNRKFLWQIQTPQSFKFDIIKDAYKKMIESNRKDITDDAMVLENFSDYRVKIIDGSYENLKITTPEDLLIAETLQKYKKIEKNT